MKRQGRIQHGHGKKPKAPPLIHQSAIWSLKEYGRSSFQSIEKYLVKKAKPAVEKAAPAKKPAASKKPSFLKNVFQDSVTYTEHAKSKRFIINALKRQGRTSYGFGDLIYPKHSHQLRPTNRFKIILDK
jgi:hypothetical protein